MTSLAVELERQRMQHRAHRIEQVLAALYERREQRPAHGVAPAPLEQVIADFTDELLQLRADLAT